MSTTPAAKKPNPSRLSLFAVGSVLPTVTVAPSLGTAGTAVRVLVALLVAMVVLRRPARTPVAPTLLLLVWVGVVCALAVGASSLGYGLERLVNWTMFVPLFFLGAGPAHLATTARALVGTAWLQMIGVALQVAGMLGGTWGGLLTSGRYHDPSTRNWLTRYTGFLGNPNDLGLVLALAAIVCLLAALLRGVRTRAMRWFLLVSAGTFVAGVVLTGSRGALIALLIGFVICIAFLPPTQRVVLVVLAGAGALALVTATRGASVDVLIESLRGIASGADPSTALRLDLWSSYATRIDSPLTGGGFGASARDADAADFARQATVDNSWLKLYLEGGLLATAVLGAMLISIVVPLLSRHIRNQERLPALALLAAAAMIGWRSLSVDLLDINPWNAIIWLVIGLALGVSGVGEPSALGVRSLAPPAARSIGPTAAPAGSGAHRFTSQDEAAPVPVIDSPPSSARPTAVSRHLRPPVGG